MNKNETLDLALEALEYLLENKTIHYTYRTKADAAITAIKQARALDKMAENARELGLDYEPNYKVTVVDDQHPKGVPLEQWGRPAPVKPVAWLYPEGLEALKAGKCWTAYGTKQDDNCNIPVYLNAAVAQKVEPVKTECDGFDSHPAAPVQQEPVATVQCINGITIGYLDVMQPVGTKLYTPPPAAQRQWVGLTNAEIDELSRTMVKGNKSVNWLSFSIEARLKENNDV